MRKGDYSAAPAALHHLDLIAQVADKQALGDHRVNPADDVHHLSDAEAGGNAAQPTGIQLVGQVIL
jgi:hypothetical protein